jgi:hypothetical protein
MFIFGLAHGVHQFDSILYITTIFLQLQPNPRCQPSLLGLHASARSISMLVFDHACSKALMMQSDITLQYPCRLPRHSSFSAASIIRGLCLYPWSPSLHLQMLEAPWSMFRGLCIESKGRPPHFSTSPQASWPLRSGDPQDRLPPPSQKSSRGHSLRTRQTRIRRQPPGVFKKLLFSQQGCTCSSTHPGRLRASLDVKPQVNLSCKPQALVLAAGDGGYKYQVSQPHFLVETSLTHL